MKKIGSIVAGNTCLDSGRIVEAVINPATEEVIAELHLATEKDIEQAIQAAKKGFKHWHSTSLSERQLVLNKAADWLREHVDEIAHDLCLEQGKPLPDARNEVMRSAAAIDWYAQAAEQIQVEILTQDGDTPRPDGARVKRMPHACGPVLAMTPWNFPLWLAARKLAPALAVGCSVIFKGAEETPATAHWITRAFLESGLPGDVLSLLLGQPAQISSRVIESGVVRHVTFTGSVPVGKLLATQCGQQMIPGTWELGGHSAAIVTKDVDPVATAKQLAGFKFRNCGQICVSPNRFFVAREIYREFIEAFVEVAQAQVIGDGFDSGVTLGPLANSRRLDAMQSLVADALAKGAKLEHGGERYSEKGFFFTPTVLSDVPMGSTLMSDEPFGPIAPIVAFDDLDDAIEQANALPYGLAGYIFTGDETTRLRIEQSLEAGFIHSNIIGMPTEDLPWCGMKDSGYGYEGGLAGLEGFIHKKLVFNPAS